MDAETNIKNQFVEKNEFYDKSNKKNIFKDYERNSRVSNFTNLLRKIYLILIKMKIITNFNFLKNLVRNSKKSTRSCIF